MSREEKIAIGCIVVCLMLAVFFAYITAPIHNKAGSVDKIQHMLGPADIYPPVPGAINAAITQANIGENICNKNWSTKSIRPTSSYTTALKKKQIVALGLKDTNLGDYEEDHLVSLELGGNPTDPNNLWPEPYTASIPDGGAKTKDKVENFLHAQVCVGTMTLGEAQKEIVTDWYAVYVHNLAGKYGSVEPQNDPDDETVDN